MLDPTTSVLRGITVRLAEVVVELRRIANALEADRLTGEDNGRIR